MFSRLMAESYKILHEHWCPLAGVLSTTPSKHSKKGLVPLGNYFASTGRAPLNWAPSVRSTCLEEIQAPWPPENWHSKSFCSWGPDHQGFCLRQNPSNLCPWPLCRSHGRWGHMKAHPFCLFKHHGFRPGQQAHAIMPPSKPGARWGLPWPMSRQGEIGDLCLFSLHFSSAFRVRKHKAPTLCKGSNSTWWWLEDCGLVQEG